MCTVTRTFWLLLLGVQVRSRTAFAVVGGSGVVGCLSTYVHRKLQP